MVVSGDFLYSSLYLLSLEDIRYISDTHTHDSVLTFRRMGTAELQLCGPLPVLHLLPR